MIFDKEAKITQWNKIMFSTNDPGTTELAYAKKEKLGTDLTTFIKKTTQVCDSPSRTTPNIYRC